MSKFTVIFSGVIAIVVAIIGLIILLPKAAAPENKQIPPSANFSTTMKITSPNFEQNTVIPKKFTCEGGNGNPELTIEGVPENTKSLALIMDDPDAPNGTFIHWLLWNIDPKPSPIKEGAPPEKALEGKNSNGKIGYIGPCPPPGKPHRYFFKLYALDAVLDVPAGSSKDALEAEINKHLLAKTELIGMYQR